MSSHESPDGHGQPPHNKGQEETDCSDWQATESYKHVSWTDLPAFTSRHGIFGSSQDIFGNQQEAQTNKLGTQPQDRELATKYLTSQSQVQSVRSGPGTTSKRKRDSNSPFETGIMQQEAAAPLLQSPTSSQQVSENTNVVGNEAEQHDRTAGSNKRACVQPVWYNNEEDMQQQHVQTRFFDTDATRSDDQMDTTMSVDSDQAEGSGGRVMDASVNEEQRVKHPTIAPRHWNNTPLLDDGIQNQHDGAVMLRTSVTPQSHARTMNQNNFASTPVAISTPESSSKTQRSSMIPRLRSGRCYSSLTPTRASANISTQPTSPRITRRATHQDFDEDNDDDEDELYELSDGDSSSKSDSSEVQGKGKKVVKKSKKTMKISRKADALSSGMKFHADDSKRTPEDQSKLQLYGIINPTPQGFLHDYWVSRSRTQQLAIEAALDEDQERAYKKYCVGLVSDLRKKYAPDMPQSSVFPPVGFRDDYWIALTGSQRSHVREGIKANPDREYARHVAGLTSEYQQQYKEGHAHGNTKPPVGFLASYWKTLSRLERSHIRDGIKGNAAREYAKHLPGLTHEYQQKYQGPINHGNLSPPEGFTVQYWSMLTGKQRGAIRGKLKTNPTATYQTHLKGLTLEYQNLYVIEERAPPEFRETYWQTLTDSERRETRKGLRTNRAKTLSQHLSGLLRNRSGQLVRKIREGVHKRYELRNVTSDDPTSSGDEFVHEEDADNSLAVGDDSGSVDDVKSHDLSNHEDPIVSEEEECD